MSYVKWIKIVTDIFDDEKILLIESMPDSDAILVIWFKLLCLAGRINNGGVLILGDGIAYTDEMLATIFRRPINTIRLALSTFEKFQMIEIVNGAITIPNWSKHQNLDKIEKRNDYMKNYMREYREKQKSLANGDCKLNSKANVSSLEEEGELELDLDNKDKEIYKEIVNYLNKKANKTYKPTSSSTISIINARLKEGYKLEDFVKVIDIKVDEWLNNDKMNKYLRPKTLFGSKFEGYLNESQTVEKNIKDYGW